MKTFKATITSGGPLDTNSYYIKAEVPATTHHFLHPLLSPPLCFKSGICGRTELPFCDLLRQKWMDRYPGVYFPQTTDLGEWLWVFIVCVSGQGFASLSILDESPTKVHLRFKSYRTGKLIASHWF